MQRHNQLLGRDRLLHNDQLHHHRLDCHAPPRPQPEHQPEQQPQPLRAASPALNLVLRHRVPVHHTQRLAFQHLLRRRHASATWLLRRQQRDTYGPVAFAAELADGTVPNLRGQHALQLVPRAITERTTTTAAAAARGCQERQRCHQSWHGWRRADWKDQLDGQVRRGQLGRRLHPNTR